MIVTFIKADGMRKKEIRHGFTPCRPPAGHASPVMLWENCHMFPNCRLWAAHSTLWRLYFWVKARLARSVVQAFGPALNKALQHAVGSTKAFPLPLARSNK
jgi:hypothetical protein